LLLIDGFCHGGSKLSLRFWRKGKGDKNQPLLLLNFSLTYETFFCIISPTKKVGFNINAMLRLSRKAEYAIIALKHMLNREAEHLCTSKEIAGRYRIPDELMAKILQKLARSGLVSSTQGVRGGYILGKSPHRITVADIVECIDGPVGIVECATEGDDCKCMQYGEGLCNISDPFLKIQIEFKNFLNGISLADLNQPASRSSKLYQITV
jgi:Rrf2 family protein